MNISSSAGIISLLEEPMPELKVFALKKLDLIVDEFWAEISEAIEKIEILHEDKGFPERHLAALVASKVYYHLGSFEDSLTYALGAGDLFDVNDKSQYVETIIAKCIDHYTQLRVSNAEEAGEGDGHLIDARLEGIVDRMLSRCFQDGQYRQALGIALETRRMDVFQKAIMDSDDVAGMLQYAFTVAMSLIQNRQFRNAVLRALVDLYRNLATPDYVNMCQCLIFLDDPSAVAQVLERLIRGTQDSALMGYQIAFDLYDSATQQFVGRVLQALRVTAPLPALLAGPVTAAAPAEHAADRAEQPGDARPQTADQLSERDQQVQKHYERLTTILAGDVAIQLHLQFLIRGNHTDLMILKQVKDTVRASVCHTALVVAHGYMQCGTTSDQFLRDNLDWLSRAYSWAKMSATASLGVIHKGHEKEALGLMQAYLPKDAAGSSGYTEGGALYALGLIHVNHGAAIIDYLVQQLKEANNEVVRHGGCLGVGLAAMGTHRADIYEQLKLNLYQDDAVTGEAAGIAMGLVMLGSKSAQAIEDMVAYSQETQHEKILRGLAVGIALTMYERLEEADTLITSLCSDKDPILRRSGMYTVAMAYCGTGNNQAIRRLLHVAVSDVNDDVRRAAVIAIGFLLFHNPEQCPSVVSLLSESYNPHVRYGAAMALGVACAGTGSKEALYLLEPMCYDLVNYVRQGALIASALVLIQQTEQTCPKVKDFRQLYTKVVSDKHEDVMAKLGAILAKGIIDAGGRNVTVALQSRTGHNNMAAVVGMLVFTQYWFWYPLAHFLCLAFTPTCLVGLNADLRMPQMEVRSNARPSMYAYPPPIEERKREDREKVATAVLSITARAKRKEAEKKKDDKPEKMDVDDDTKKDAGQEKDKKDKQETEKDEKEKADAKKKEEPAFEMLSNPARVLRHQLRVVQPVEGSRYQTVKDLRAGGILMVRDTGAGAQQLVDWVVAHGPQKEPEEAEPEPPEPFDYEE
ncbi:26S proteasome non-ATPase regulatory subunit 1-like [Pollicipes pollicipes]|uniref:26S proteasome non-ATPase regulatory subunit 1-like n=1 Tax=Pollicipes pollicipes TaxID=41117 RepID=UPI0018854AAC|nr:26S proteasome non-ATPase regulatory subunit 1-like [Pollicipes pollicipes]